jgi:hypothetical protein
MEGKCGRAVHLSLGDSMRKRYDFSNARKNPYVTQLKKSVTIRLDEGQSPTSRVWQTKREFHI